ncbi:hypothetical protein ACRFV7_005306 [Klebsiella oxytoca]|uniref:Uncharacterized protein n=12 Tax=Klebsiella/Raoultella group TaxID=2890311 RepID=A0A7H0EVT8_KLEVA|nr:MULTISPECIES: hypothetical protein [Enterobacteriaceae]MBS6125069.1 hypothetical protein [Veillonella sp.]ANS55246.1 hypothetical protein [Klebsiella pneumoniae]ARV42902.1 hypothetical protein RJA_27480 [Klebsiella pneumoniae subsp. pneumoniae]AUH88441.1 hypothetical protein CYE04_28400 [Klebsiella pneumoniae]AUT25173.1 hypothetical protein CEA73_26550 [Klebsiella pneumoniae]
MNFRALACLFLLLPTAGNVMADSQLQLSSDVIVDQHQETVKGKTSYFKNKVDDAKYIRISNQAASFPLILSLPEVNYSVIVKNGHATLASEGKDLIWVEPGSYVILHIKEGAKFYDFIPVVYIIGKDTPKALTVIPGKEISAAKLTEIIDYKNSPVQKTLTSKDKVTGLSDFKNIKKLKTGFYKIQVNQFTSVNFDKEIYIISRNNMLAGSQYFTRKLIAYPREQIIISISGETHVKK